MKNEGIMIIKRVPKTCKECKFSLPGYLDMLCLALDKHVEYDSKDKDCPIHKI